jgi:2-polyprenyl-3-methyl-5-hydroxy-6-metoxy-1,4-benzoquinol methylase
MTHKENAICPLSGEPARFYCRKPPADYYITASLGLIYQKELPTVEQMAAYAEDQYAAGVYKGYASAAHLKIATFERRIELLKRLGVRGRILDVGSACGFFIEAALKHGLDAYGIEFSKEAVAMAREDIRPRITIGDVNLLRQRGDEQFDAVVAFDIIEHTQNPLKFLDEIRQILRPGGWLMLATPDTDHFLRYLMKDRWPMLQPMQHTYLFSKAAMRYALEKAGYENIGVRKADKSLTLDYLIDQIHVHNPVISRAYQVASKLLPGKVRQGTFAVNIGEMLAYAQRKA